MRNVGLIAVLLMSLALMVGGVYLGRVAYQDGSGWLGVACVLTCLIGLSAFASVTDVMVHEA